MQKLLTCTLKENCNVKTNRFLLKGLPNPRLQNETNIIKISQAVLEIFNFWTILREKTTEKPKMLFLRGFAQTEEQQIV